MFPGEAIPFADKGHAPIPESTALPGDNGLLSDPIRPGSAVERQRGRGRPRGLVQSTALGYRPPTQLVALKYFVAVADHGSFNAAAERLGVSPSTLTRRVSTLEDDLGLTLFERSRKGVALTPAAVPVLAETKRMLAGLEGVTDAAAAQRVERPARYDSAFALRRSANRYVACWRAGARTTPT
jgi:molybdenum-dependent DNA-binding transcriptional regulator ModE